MDLHPFSSDSSPFVLHAPLLHYFGNIAGYWSCVQTGTVEQKLRKPLTKIVATTSGIPCLANTPLV